MLNLNINSLFLICLFSSSCPSRVWSRSYTWEDYNRFSKHMEGIIIQALFCTVVKTQSSYEFWNSNFLCDYIFHNIHLKKLWQMWIISCNRKKVLDRCLFFNTPLKTSFIMVNIFLLKSAFWMPEIWFHIETKSRNFRGEECFLLKLNPLLEKRQ